MNVEGSHEAIIDKDVFLKVQAEMAKRANLAPQGKKKYVWRCVSRVLKKSSGIDS